MKLVPPSEKYGDISVSRAAGDGPQAQVRKTMRTNLFERLLSRRNRVTVFYEPVEERTNKVREKGIVIGEW